jgi:hypothetical protein
MSWLNKIFPKKPKAIFLDAANNYFDEVCVATGESSAADIYRKHPEVKATHKDAILNDFAVLIGSADDASLTSRMRGKWASQLSKLVDAHFYTNLEEADRDALAKWTEQDRTTLDESYYWGIALHYTYASILGAIILNGWNGTPESKQLLDKQKQNYIDCCKEWSQLTITLARKHVAGMPVTDEDRRNGKTASDLMELTRRSLAGEKVYDE